MNIFKEMKNKVHNKKIMVVFIVMGCISIVVGVYDLISSIVYINIGIETEGIIVNFIESKGSDNEILYAAQYEFYDAEGKLFTDTSSTSSENPTVEVGEEVSILYLENNPNWSKINSSSYLYYPGITFLLVGSFFVILGLFNYKKSK